MDTLHNFPQLCVNNNCWSSKFNRKRAPRKININDYSIAYCDECFKSNTELKSKDYVMYDRMNICQSIDENGKYICPQYPKWGDKTTREPKYCPKHGKNINGCIDLIRKLCIQCGQNRCVFGIPITKETKDKLNIKLKQYCQDRKNEDSIRNRTISNNKQYAPMRIFRPYTEQELFEINLGRTSICNECYKNIDDKRYQNLDKSRVGRCITEYDIDITPYEPLYEINAERPKSTISHNLRYKEKYIMKHLKDELSHKYDMTFNCTLLGSNYRPDCYIKINRFHIIIEIDEFQHKLSEYKEDEQRINDIFKLLGSKNLFVIRVNADKYVDRKGSIIKSPWTTNEQGYYIENYTMNNFQNLLEIQKRIKEMIIYIIFINNYINKVNKDIIKHQFEVSYDRGKSISTQYYEFYDKYIK